MTRRGFVWEGTLTAGGLLIYPYCPPAQLVILEKIMVAQDQIKGDILISGRLFFNIPLVVKVILLRASLNYFYKII